MAMTMQYILRERGPMTSLGGVEGLGFVHTKYSNTSDDYPDIQFHMAPASINSDNGVQVRKILGLTDNLYESVYRPIDNKDVWTLMPLLLRPHSRGWIRLRSKNPFHYPAIHANYFHDRRDIDTLVEGVKIALQVSSALRARKHNSFPSSTPLNSVFPYRLVSRKLFANLTRDYIVYKYPAAENMASTMTFTGNAPSDT